MHKPFKIIFKLDSHNVISEISLNRKTGEFYYFPKEQDFFDVTSTIRQLFVSEDDIPIYDDVIDHISWHMDGTLHLKYKNIDVKSVITKIETSFSTFNRNTLLPLISHSVRDRNGKPGTIIALLAGLDIIENIELLPSPYSNFIIKGQKNEHISAVTNTESNLPFGYIFISVPIFVPITDNNAHFSFTVPLQEDDLLAVIAYLKTEKKRFIFAPLHIDELTVRTDQ